MCYIFSPQIRSPVNLRMSAKKPGNQDSQESRSFTPAEWKAIQVHKYFLSERAGHQITDEEAVEDWLKKHAREWRATRMIIACGDQMKEILRHKWIESEKAGCDQGKAAVKDWIRKYAQQWRANWEKSH